MTGKYKTIHAISEGFYKEKGSKFFAFAIPVKTEDEIKEHIAKLRKEHFQAVHVCSAFRLGSDLKKFRSSDDGEPSNSAGPPILGQIQAFELTNILIAVVRYYGGTNLGVGGLIQAYRTAAKEALESAIIVEEEDQLLLQLDFSYDEMPEVMRLVKLFKANQLQQNYELTCQLILQIPYSAKGIVEEITHFNTVNNKELISFQWLN